MVDQSDIAGLKKEIRAIATDQRANSDLADTRNAVNDAARVVRNLSLSFLLVGLYILILGAQTSHVQLLRGDPVQLPLLGVEVNIVAAYALAPVLLVILHANLIVQYVLLARRIEDFNWALTYSPQAVQEAECNRLFPLPFVSLAAIQRPRGVVRLLLMAVVSVSLLHLPTFVLLWTQIRFLPYQHDYLTILHQSLIVTDLVLFVTFRRAIGAAFTGTGNYGLRWYSPVVWWSLAILILTFFVAVHRPLGWILADPNSNEFTIQIPAPDGLQLARFQSNGLQPLGILLRGEDWPFEKDIGDDEFWLDKLLQIDRRLVVKARTLMLREPDPAIYVRYREEAENGDQETEANSNAHLLSDDGDRQARLDRDHGEPLDLTDRNFRFADLSGSILPRVLLEKADFSNANLNQTQLPGANLRGARLQGAWLGGAQLQDTNLGRAQLQGAFLAAGAQLQGARLGGAQLQGADLGGAQLQGAILYGANLQGADLGGAQLQGANLGEAQLQGADLGEAQLQGADLGEAQLQGADLGEAQLQGARLSGAQLQGANLWRTAWTNIMGLSSTNFSLTDLTDRSVEAFGDYEDWQQAILRHIEDPRIATSVKWRLNRMTDGVVPLDRAPQQGLLSIEELPVDEEHQLADFWQPLAQFLRKLVCDSTIAPEARPNFIWRLSGDNVPVTIVVDFANGLLESDDTCAAADTFGDSLIQQVQRLKQSAETRLIDSGTFEKN